MNRFLSLLLVVAAGGAVFYPTKTPISLDSEVSNASELNANELINWNNAPSYKFHRTGKALGAKPLSTTYSKNSLSNFSDFPEIGPEVINGLKNQLRVLKIRKNKKEFAFGNLHVQIEQLQETIELLMKYAERPEILNKALDAHQIKGKDGKGNVHYTGYFTPVLKVSRVKDAVYKYPIYQRPQKWLGKLPSRAEIEGEKAFEGLGLELAYAKDAIDLYFMQVQGSGIVEYLDGTHEHFAYNSGNGHKYKSIGNFMIKQGLATIEKVSIKHIKKYVAANPEMQDTILFSNPNYIFFESKPAETKTRGAAQVPLTSNHSIAVDPDYFPLGGCYLAAVPVVNRKGVCTNHEYRLLFAQDVGGAINGPGHVDLYQGIGKKGQIKASALHHYGGLWLLLPKSPDSETPEVLRAGGH